MKRITALWLILATVCMILVGCTANGYYSQQVKNVWAGNPVEPYSEPTETTTEATTEETTEPGTTTETTAPTPQGPMVLEGENGDLQFVMIYNPKIYKGDTSSFDDKLNPGDFSAQVEVQISRGPTALPDPGVTMVSTGLLSTLPTGLQIGANPSPLVKTYQVGDTQEFFHCQDLFSNTMKKSLFTCRHTGTYCNVWTLDNTMDDATIASYADEFDNKVYRSVTGLFGKPRFVENGTKINLLYYPMENNIGGYFTTADIFSSDEISAAEATANSFNLDHAMIHFNSDFAMDPNQQTFMRGTLAHEFQHLIFGTDAVESKAQVCSGTWLNEAMSGYIEEKLYPGSKAEGGHVAALSASENIRAGQSLYNFYYEEEIGVYGSVYMYSQYLTDLAGESVLTEIHDYWRNSDSMTLCDAEAIYASVENGVISQVDGTVTYPDSWVFDSQYEEWMSKLTLDFHLSLLTQGAGAPAAYAEVDPMDLVYGKSSSPNIEGGGRIIIAVKNGVYEIPSDADSGLVYIGLDKDFQPVTDFVCG